MSETKLTATDITVNAIDARVHRHDIRPTPINKSPRTLYSSGKGKKSHDFAQHHKKSQSDQLQLTAKLSALELHLFDPRDRLQSESDARKQKVSGSANTNQPDDSQELNPNRRSAAPLPNEMRNSQKRIVYSERVNSLEERAANEDRQAQYELGMHHHINRGGTKEQNDANQATAMEWFRYAAENLHEDALASLKRGADLGNEHAQFNLGLLYCLGKGVNKDYRRGLRLCLLASAQGNQKANNFITKVSERGSPDQLHDLASVYKSGDPEIQNSVKAFLLYKAAADKEFVPSMVRLADSYGNGKGTEKNAEQAFKWYQKASEHGDNRGTISKAKCLLKGVGVEEDPHEAFRLFKQVADTGDSDAEFWVGRCYMDGKGAAENHEIGSSWLAQATSNGSKGAFEWLKCHALQKGNSYAQFEFAKILLVGAGLDKDEAAAITLFAKAAKNGHLESHFMLGSYFLNKPGRTPMDEKRAFKWNEIAASRGHIEAQFQLGVMYSKGYGVEKSLERGFEWYSKAAARGHFSAKYAVARAHYMGAGTKQDYAKAAPRLLDMADHNCVEAYLPLGKCYEYARGVPTDERTAYTWYVRYAEESSAEESSKMFRKLERLKAQNKPDVQFHIAKLYQSGDGVPQNKERAMEWFQVAAANGHSEARAALANRP